MTEEQFLALQEQVNKNTQAIEELKEAFQTLSTATPCATSLIDALQQQVADLTASHGQMHAELDRVAGRTQILEGNVTTNTNDIALLKQMPSGPQMELVGTTLNITLPATEEAAAAEETTEST